MARQPKIVNKFGDVRVTLQGAKVKAQDRFAEIAVDHARGNAPIDTGFYKDHLYAMTSAEGGYASDLAFLPNRMGYIVKRESNAVGGVQIASSAIVASAAYAIYVEFKYNTVYNAVQYAESQFPQIVAEIRQEFKLGR